MFSSVYLAGFLITLVLVLNTGVPTAVFSSMPAGRLGQSLAVSVVAGVGVAWSSSSTRCATSAVRAVGEEGSSTAVAPFSVVLHGRINCRSWW